MGLGTSDGLMDNVMIYGAALSGDEVLALFQAAATPADPTPNEPDAPVLTEAERLAVLLAETDAKIKEAEERIEALHLQALEARIESAKLSDLLAQATSAEEQAALTVRLAEVDTEIEALTAELVATQAEVEAIVIQEQTAREELRSIPSLITSWLQALVNQLKDQLRDLQREAALLRLQLGVN